MLKIEKVLLELWVKEMIREVDKTIEFFKKYRIENRKFVLCDKVIKVKKGDKYGRKTII